MTHSLQGIRHHHAHPELAKELICLSSLLPLYTYTIAHAHKANERPHGDKYTHTKPPSNYTLLPAGKGGVFLVFPISYTRQTLGY